MTLEQLHAIEARWRAATPEPIVKMRYEHGGGRAYKTPDGNPESMPRTLIIDCYEEADREFYFHAREDLPALSAEWRRLTAVIHRLEERLGMERDSAVKELLA